ncbi:MAG: hypothetical protein LBO04_03165 [Spirochaetaceae bacterium]|nr:hypothetical protein [Spirochaetaceae bacterium]
MIKRAVDGAGVRATARGLGVSSDKVYKRIKKKKRCRSM